MVHMSLRSLVLSSFLYLSLASAQSNAEASTTSSPSSSSSEAASSSSNGPITHTVDVAKGGFTFVPDVILAKKGDVIEFNFFPDNHSVVRAEYGYPCIPYELTGVDKIGFFSGFKPVDTIVPDVSGKAFFSVVNVADQRIAAKMEFDCQ